MMNRALYYIALCLLCTTKYVFAPDPIIVPEISVAQPSALIPFSYTNEDLVNIVNYIVGLLNKNVFLPQGRRLFGWHKPYIQH